ncbi:unnamed protein product [Brachionus calyciflorus]|uniref:Uncharacterized protein n=1 Tax=Brachionus calyciflorus TaxID=104777 RepID=A0A813MFH2_9BILA|nr:unnamed protein product [Brachionus calyciflorus]
MPYRSGTKKKRKELNFIERVQRRATKLVPKLRNLDYETRLRMTGLTTLEKRRERGDLIQFYKVYNGINKIIWFHPFKPALSINTTGPASSVRGHNRRIERLLTSNWGQRHNFLVNRILPNWNNLQSQRVRAKTTKSFKNLLDAKETNI